MAEVIQLDQRLPRAPLSAQAERRDQYLAFTLGEETFATDIRSIKEVIQFSSLTQVPLMPDFILGVLNLRGAVVPIIDVSVRFGRACTRPSHRTCIVILEVRQGEEVSVLGVMVDSVSEVLEIAENQIEPAPAFGSRIRTEFLQGVAKVAGKFVLLLEINRVLSVDELAALACARPQTGA